METINILVVDDDREIVNAICKLLESEGYKNLKGLWRFRCYRYFKSEYGSSHNTWHYDAKSGRTYNYHEDTKRKKTFLLYCCQQKLQESDIVLGLSMGADDYISKPYAPSELLARVKSQTRRYLKLGSYGNISSNEEIITNLGLELNVTKKQLFVDGRGS